MLAQQEQQQAREEGAGQDQIEDVMSIDSLPKLAEKYQGVRGASGRGGGMVKFTRADLEELKLNGFATMQSLIFPSMRRLLQVTNSYIFTQNQICSTGKQIDLLQVKGVSEQKAELLLRIGRAFGGTQQRVQSAKDKNAAGAIVEFSEGGAMKTYIGSSTGTGFGFRSAREVLAVRQNLLRISTGSPKLDMLLRGGIEVGGITEMFGEFRSGKSQMCHQLCVTAQFPPESGGAGGKVLFIDTESTFRPERIEDKRCFRSFKDPPEIFLKFF